MQSDIIIIGAGPAGLMAAYELAKSDHKVIMLEARDRIGGRAFTMPTEDFFLVEAGAEFIHGTMPLTLELVKKAELSYTAISGNWIEQKGGMSTEGSLFKELPRLLRKLKALETDMTFQDFLEKYFPGPENAALKDHAIAYAEGYDSADTSRVSAKALYREWSKLKEDDYRIDEGYGSLMNFLATGSNCLIFQSHPVSTIRIGDKRITVTAAGMEFHASQVIIAVPLAVLQQDNAIRFIPSVNRYTYALQQIGMGDVIKFIFSFKEAFWEKEYPDLGFLITGASVPTWWTQTPARNNMITGWMSGRSARAHAHMDTQQLRRIALESLAQIFSRKLSELEEELVEDHVFNWSADPYSLGSYSYGTVNADEAKTVLARPINGRIFFAGEYMYDGPAMGTVEAALQSGLAVAKQIMGGD